MLKQTFNISFTALIIFLTETAMSQEITPICVSPYMEQCSIYSSINADGRFVVFGSRANNLVAGDTNGTRDVFVRDRLTAQTTRVSVASNGTQANGPSDPDLYSLSADGRYVAFLSYATNLIVNDTNKEIDVFVHDRSTKQTTRASISSTGAQANKSSGIPAISADGRYVAFTSDADNLVKNDTNNVKDAFIHDRSTKQTTRVNVSSSRKQANDRVEFISLSADGRFVAFSSWASNLVEGDVNNAEDIFVHDRLTKKTSLISVANNGRRSNSDSFRPSLSADGRYVTFVSYDLYLADTDVDISPTSRVVYLFDRQTRKLSLIDKTTGLPFNKNNESDSPVLSADGRYVAYLHRQFFNDAQWTKDWDVFIYDRMTNRSSNIVGGVLNDYSNKVSLSADGRFFTFLSFGYGVPGISVFVYDRFLDATRHADLKITGFQTPVSIMKNGYGAFHFVVTNNGPDVVYNVNVTHVLSNGSKLSAFISTQGTCNRYANISLCQLGKLLPGGKADLFTIAKAERNPLIQRLFVSARPMDQAPFNNRIYLSTPVKN